MRDLAAIEITALVNELRALEGAYLNKFYDLGDGAFRLSLSKDGKQADVYCKLCKAFGVTMFKEEAGPATLFAIAMRKRVEGKRITAIAQHGADRVIVISLFGDDGYRIIIEMFGKGNLALVDKEDTIVLTYKVVKQRDRSVAPKGKYAFPKSESLLSSASEEEIASTIEKVLQSDDKIIVAISRQVNIGPMYIEDILSRLGIDPKSKASRHAGSANKITKSITAFFDAARHPEPRLYLQESGPADFAILPIMKYEVAGYTTKSYATLGALLDESALGGRTEVKSDKFEKEKKEVELSIKKQKLATVALIEEGKRSRAAANSIMARMGEINELVSFMKDNKKATLDELKSRFAGLDIKEINLKTKTVKINVKDENEESLAEVSA